MAKNLRHVMRTNIMFAFRENMNKHQIKMTDKDQVGVWSYGTKFDLLNKADTFSKYCSEQGVTRLEKVDRALITQFLESKSNEGCTDRTVEAYRSAISRIGTISKCDWSVERVVSRGRAVSPDRGAASVISQEDYNKLIEYCERNPSKSGACVLLEREIGVRVADMAYGMRITDTELKISSKNGKICTRPITPKVRNIIESKPFKSMIKGGGGRVRCPQDDSINKYLRRTEDKLKIERHSFHDLRRFKAQEKYNEYRKKGLNRTEALSAVGVWLNHGENRAKMVLESYIQNAW